MKKLIQFIVAIYEADKRWRKANRLGLRLVGTALAHRNDKNQFRHDWAIRNSNRLHRLTHGKAPKFCTKS